MTSLPLPDQQPNPLPTTALHSDLIHRYGAEKSWRQTLSNALIITEREVRDSFRDWRIIIPIFLLTLVFPMLANLASALFTGLLESSSDFEDTGEVLNTFLPLMPMLVGFFPTSISLVIALESFVGEKERMSLEPMLSTPLTNAELYIGKVLASIIPPLSAAYLGITIYVGGQVLGAQQWRPEIMLIVQILMLTTVQAILMVTGAVVISSQTTSTRAANLLASAIIVPMSMLVIVESLVMIQPAARHALWWIMLGLVMVIILLLRTGTRIFNREELLGRSIDHINLGWAGRVFVDQWTGGVQGFNPLLWYQVSVVPALFRLKKPLVVFGICAVMAFIGGWSLRERYPLPLDEANLDDQSFLENLQTIFESGQKTSVTVLVLEQNMRVLLLATFLAMMTFGVLGLLITAFPFGIYGYVLGNIAGAGLSPLPFLLALFPHGLVEIPAIMIAGASALQLGLAVTQPTDKMTVGEVWIRQLADSLKLLIAVVLPLLIIAAILEVQLTPDIVKWAVTQ